MQRILLLLASSALAGAPVSAQVTLTTDAALELAFPKCKIERRTITLTASQQAAIGKLCGQTFKKAMAFAYIARRDGKLVGTAWFDVHKVRSKQQLLMVAIKPDYTVHRVEVLAFSEPRRYAAPKGWLTRLHGQRLGTVTPGRDVPRITGATITVGATTRCVERNLALHEVVFPRPAPKPAPKPTEDRQPPGKSAKGKRP